MGQILQLTFLLPFPARRFCRCFALKSNRFVVLCIDGLDTICINGTLLNAVPFNSNGLIPSCRVESFWVWALSGRCLWNALAFEAHRSSTQSKGIFSSSVCQLLLSMVRHMLHVAAWPRGVFAWERTLRLMNLPPRSKKPRLVKLGGNPCRDCRKLPAPHMRDAHPGFTLGLRLVLVPLRPTPLMFCCQVGLDIQNISSCIGKHASHVSPCVTCTMGIAPIREYLCRFSLSHPRR